jgi:hypothetical protein
LLRLTIQIKLSGFHFKRSKTIQFNPLVIDFTT